MTDEDARDLNALSGAIGWLRQMRQIVSGELRGTNDPRYEDCRDAQRAVKEAEDAYKRLAGRLR